MSTRRDVASPLEVAASQALLAHRALGQMSACTTVAEFTDAATALMSAVRGISQSLAWLARVSASDGSDRRRAFTAWFATQVVGVMQHPLQSEVQGSAQKPPAIYMSRLARGSAHPPIREHPALGQMAAVMKPRPEDFYFEGSDKRPAIEMCSEYLERVTSLLDQSRQAMKRFGIE